MGNEKLTAQQQELLHTQEGALAALIGYVAQERGKIQTSVLNKLTVKLGYAKQSTNDLKELGRLIEEDEDLWGLYDLAKRRVIHLEDIPSVVEEKGELDEKELFQQVTPYLQANEDNNARLREMRALQRKGVHMQILMENLQANLINELKGMPRAKYLQTDKLPDNPGDKSLLLLFSDWHIGAVTYHEDTGGYNFEKLTNSVQNIVQETLAIIEEQGIKHLYVFHVGDTIEHISMRNVNQAFEAEFPATEQIAKATRLLIDVLMQLSKHTHVTFGMVAGNHDRFNGNKNDKVYNETITYIILDNLIEVIQNRLGQLPNVDIIDNRKDTYQFERTIAGKRVKVVHGDREKKKDSVKIPKHIKNDPIHYLIMGHFHTTSIIQEDYNRFSVNVGSPMGANGYSSELNLPTTYASQMMMILTEGKDTPMFLPLFDF